MAKEKVTAEQIAAWKKKHGTVFQLKVNGKFGYLKQPDRKVVSMARSLGEGDQIKIAELVLDACWLGGDEEIKTDDSLFLSVIPQLENIIELKEAVLKKI